jgi:hypothetical protein
MPHAPGEFVQLAAITFIHESNGHHMKTLLASSVLVILFGCAPKTVYVVLRDVPTKPSFVILPANDYIREVEFANVIETYFLSSGVKVVEHPGRKEVQATKQAAQMEAQSGQAAAAQGTITEKFWALENTDADYLVRTYADTKQIKIVRRTTNELLASFVYSKKEYQKEDQIIRDALWNLGIIRR